MLHSTQQAASEYKVKCSATGCVDVSGEGFTQVLDFQKCVPTNIYITIILSPKNPGDILGHYEKARGKSQVARKSVSRLRLLFVMAGCIKISALVLIFFVCASYERPQFNLGSIFTNGIGAAFNTAIGRDCKGRAQGDYFYGCQCVGPFNIGKRSAEPVDNRLFINSNQGFGGDFVRCSVATVLNRNQG